MSRTWFWRTTPLIALVLFMMYTVKMTPLPTETWRICLLITGMTMLIAGFGRAFYFAGKLDAELEQDERDLERLRSLAEKVK